MAKLNEIFESVIKSISDARIKADIHSGLIAKEYATNELLQYFNVPVLKMDKAEVNIPIAINKLNEIKQKVYEPIDNISFSSKTYRQILKSLEVKSLSNDISKTLKNTISEHIHLLEAKIRVNQIEGAMEDFSNNITLKVVDLAEVIFKDDKRKKLTKDELLNLKNSISKGLQVTLKDEIKYKSENAILESMDVIVEANILHDVKPENVMMIKLTIVEDGYKWIKMENNKGEIISKLMLD